MLVIRPDDLQISDPPPLPAAAPTLTKSGALLQHQVSTLLIAAEQGLQAVPFAALSDGDQFFGNRYGLALTPSLSLTDLSTPGAQEGDRLLALGASEFEGLSALPFVAQEIERVADGRASCYLNQAFTRRPPSNAGEAAYSSACGHPC